MKLLFSIFSNFVDHIVAYLSSLTSGLVCNLLLEVLLEIGYRSEDVCESQVQNCCKRHSLQLVRGAYSCVTDPLEPRLGFAKTRLYTQNNTSEIN